MTKLTLFKMAPVRAESLKVETESALNSSLKIFLTDTFSSVKQNIYIYTSRGLCSISNSRKDYLKSCIAVWRVKKSAHRKQKSQVFNYRSRRNKKRICIPCHTIFRTWRATAHSFRRYLAARSPSMRRSCNPHLTVSVYSWTNRSRKRTEFPRVLRSAAAQPHFQPDSSHWPSRCHAVCSIPWLLPKSLLQERWTSC